jgi:hypothetical protein
MSALQQINITYMPEQDRLLLRTGTSDGHEYRLWLTRRYAALLTQVLQEHIDKSGGVHQLASDPQTTGHLRQGALDQAWDEGRNLFPLGPEGVLGYAIKVQRRESGSIALQLLPREGPGLNLNLDCSLLYLMYTLLEQATLQADWRLPGTATGLSVSLH